MQIHLSGHMFQILYLKRIPGWVSGRDGYRCAIVFFVGYPATQIAIEVDAQDRVLDDL